MTIAAGARRLDLELVERALAPSRARAQALIAAGLVEVDGERARSADRRVLDTAAIRVVGRDHPWAGRGGIKLAAALEHFEISPRDRVCLDAGASTGGFTDVLIAGGATLVYAVDVGRGQLDARLAADPRVHVLDRTNLRTLTGLPGEPPSLVTLDLSFISLRLVLPAVARLVHPGGADLVVLFKPQFEMGRSAVGRGGIVGDEEAAAEAAREFAQWLETAFGAQTRAPLASPIRGAKGNQEWLIAARLPRHTGTGDRGGGL